MPDLRQLATAVLAAVAIGMPCAAHAAGVADPVDFRFQDKRIGESSGLALSVRHPHTVWTVNDSGDSARVFAVDTRTGATVGVHTFDAQVRDVEALAITPQGRMLVADIGDNAASRDLVRVFWFDEPALGSTSGPRGASWELRYPDGPHDAEALAVDPRSGRVVVVTKDRPGSIYLLPAQPSRTGVNRLTRVGPAPSTVTDAVFPADGSALAVRTYTSLHLLDPETFAVRTSTLLPLQPQGETVALAPEGSALLVGSEGVGSRVQQVDLPSVPHSDESTTSTPAPTPSSTPSTEPSRAAPSEPAARPVARQWPWAAAGLGVVVVLVALLAVTVARVSRRSGR